MGKVAISKEAASVLRLKRELDDRAVSVLDKVVWRLLRVFKRSLGVNVTRDNGSSVVRGYLFIQSVLPFSEPWYDEGESQLESVEPGFVLAGNYQGWPVGKGSDNERNADLLDRRSEKGKPGDPEVAKYARISPFPFYVVREGKNRVDLYKALDRTIKARVCTSHYPRCEELRLVRARPFGVTALRYVGKQTDVGAPLEWLELGIHVAVLPYKESIPLLESYGVQWTKSLWSLKAFVREREARLRVFYSRYRF